MWERVLGMIRKELIQTLRDPRRRVMLIGPPLIQLLVFGYAVNLDVENAALGWMDSDGTPQSRELRARFEGSPNFEITTLLSRESEVRDALDLAEVQAVVRVLPGFGSDILRGRMPAVQILVDGTNSNTAGIIASQAQQVVAAYGLQVQQDLISARAAALARAGGTVPPLRAASLSVQPRVWFNPNLKSRIYFVPGVVVNIIALVTIMLTAMSIVREREIGTMEQLMVTPIRPVELMLGKMLPYALIGLLEVMLVTAGALLVFRVPFRGSGGVLFLAATVFLLATLGIGLFLSTISHTQQQAMMSATIFFLPAMMLSGFAFPIRNMPVAVQYLTYLNPMRYFMEIVRGVFLKGTGIGVLWPQLVMMAALGAAVLGFSALRFQKRLD